MRSAWCAEEPVLVHDGVTQARWTRRASKRFGPRVRLRSQCWASRLPTNSGPEHRRRQSVGVRCGWKWDLHYPLFPTCPGLASPAQPRRDGPARGRTWASTPPAAPRKVDPAGRGPQSLLQPRFRPGSRLAGRVPVVPGCARWCHVVTKAIAHSPIRETCTREKPHFRGRTRAKRVVGPAGHERTDGFRGPGTVGCGCARRCPQPLVAPGAVSTQTISSGHERAR